MIEKIKAEVETVKKVTDQHRQNLEKFTTAREKCIASINAGLGAIETPEKLIKNNEDTEKKEEPGKEVK